LDDPSGAIVSAALGRILGQIAVTV